MEQISDTSVVVEMYEVRQRLPMHYVESVKPPKTIDPTRNSGQSYALLSPAQFSDNRPPPLPPPRFGEGLFSCPVLW